MCKLWCEWDFGQDEYLFKSEAEAVKWFDEESGCEDSYSDLIEDGLVGIDWIEIK